MALADLLNLSAKDKKIGLSEERIQAVIPALRQYIAFWREYPDLFVDFLQTGGDPNRKKELNFFFYQRCFLRAAMRYRYVYMVFPREINARGELGNKFLGNLSNCGNPSTRQPAAKPQG